MDTNFLTSITIPSFTIPLPANIAAWVAAHGILLWFANRYLLKMIDGYGGKYKWLDRLIFIMEHANGKQDVTPLAERPSFIAAKAASTAAIQTKTPNGLP